MKIQVLYFEGCPNYEQAIDLVRSVAPHASIEALEIKSQREAVRMRFLGSPTILVDGLDVEVDARSRTDFGFSCRTYGGSGVPSRELVASAIQRCATAPSERPKTRWLVGSSVIAAATTSACCWLPLALVALGASTGGPSHFHLFRRRFLAVAAILIGAGFWSAYRKSNCCTARSRRLNRAVAWLSATLALALALVPWYADLLSGEPEGSSCCAPPEEASPSTQSTGAREVKQIVFSQRKTPVTVLAADAGELKSAWNAKKEAVKVLLIVSPSCPACLAGASVIQTEALAHVDSERLEVFVVWIHRLPGDNLKAAQEATELVPDKRAAHFWDGSGALGKLYGKIVKLPGGKTFAWDVYFVFGPQAEWTASPPAPAFWMHQLGGPETGNLLDGERFRRALAEQLGMKGKS